MRGGGREPEDVELGEDALLSRWAIEELRRVSPTVALQAMGTLGRFSSHDWIGDVDPGFGDRHSDLPVSWRYP